MLDQLIRIHSIVIHTGRRSKSIRNMALRTITSNRNVRRDARPVAYGCRFRPPQHSHVEIPQQQSAILAYAAEAVVAVVAAPGVESDRCDPAVMARAACDDTAFGEGPDGDKIVLAACEDVFAVRRPADAVEGAVIGRIEICELFFEVIDDAKRAVFGDDSEMTTVRREAEVCDSVVRDFPGSDWVSFLILRIDRFVDMEGFEIGIEGALVGGVRAVGFGDKGGIVALLVIDYQATVHMGSEEEVLRAGKPSDL